MGYIFDAGGVERLEEYFGLLGEVLRMKKRKASFAAYAMGLLGSVSDKNMEAIAAHVFGPEKHAGSGHQKLQYFVSEADWDDQEMRRAAAWYAIDVLSQQEPIQTWIIDDTGFLKKGTQSVGVQRQYTGTAGKTTNCQIGVSLSVATDNAHVPIDFELYLPKSWIENPERRKQGGIPEDAQFRTKIELALGMIENAAQAGIPGTTILGDCFYGCDRKFRDAVFMMGFDYGLAIHSTDKMLLVDENNVVGDQVLSAKQIASTLGAQAFRTYIWREGTGGMLSSRFALCRVAVPTEGTNPDEYRREWLVIEWPEGKKEPRQFVLTTLCQKMAPAEIIRIIRERYRTEKVYEEMKGGLGLDQFQGRSFRGWHHHVSVAICCYAFIAAERARYCLPKPRAQANHNSIKNAA